MFDYQRVWYEAGQAASAAQPAQIAPDWGDLLCLEAFIDALVTGATRSSCRPANHRPTSSSSTSSSLPTQKGWSSRATPWCCRTGAPLLPRHQRPHRAGLPWQHLHGRILLIHGLRIFATWPAGWRCTRSGVRPTFPPFRPPIRHAKFWSGEGVQQGQAQGRPDQV